MKKEHISYRLLNLLMLMAVVYLVLNTSNYWGTFIAKVFSTLMPFLLAFAFAYILHPFVERLERKGVRRPLALLSVILVVLFIVVGLVWLTVPVVYDQLISFTKTVTEVINNFNGKFDVELGNFEATVLETLNELIKKFGNYISTGTIDILGKSVNFITNAMIIFFVTIYLLIDMNKIRAFVKKFLKRWFFEYSILFKLVGHPNWLLLGLLACFTTIIPYFGGIITNVIAVITATAISWKLCIATLIITLIFPNIDGYLISPHIYGKTNNVNPVLVIITMGFFSKFLGILGIVMGLPIYIVLRCTWEYFDDDIKEKIQDVKGVKEKGKV